MIEGPLVLTFGEHEVTNPNGDEVSGALSRLQNAADPDSYLSLRIPDTDIGLTCYFSAGLGFLVSGAGSTDGEFLTLIDPARSAAPVAVYLGGDETAYSRLAFVGRDSASRALGHFAATGRLEQELDWRAAESVMVWE